MQATIQPGTAFKINFGVGGHAHRVEPFRASLILIGHEEEVAELAAEAEADWFILRERLIAGTSTISAATAQSAFFMIYSSKLSLFPFIALRPTDYQGL